jgi:hypothetical protein
MLKVKYTILRMPERPSSLIRHLVERANANAKALAYTLSKESRQDGCDFHTDEESIATVTAQWDLRPTVEKTDFCCPHYANKYDFGGPPMEGPLVVNEESEVIADDPAQQRLWPLSLVAYKGRSSAKRKRRSGHFHHH